MPTGLPANDAHPRHKRELCPAREPPDVRSPRQAGARAELHLYDGLPHAFDANSAYSRTVSDLIHLFLQRNMPASGAAEAAAANEAISEALCALFTNVLQAVATTTLHQRFSWCMYSVRLLR